MQKRAVNISIGVVLVALMAASGIYSANLKEKRKVEAEAAAAALPEGEHEAHASHAGACTGDHWYVLAAIPGVSDHLCGAFGNGVVSKTAADRGAHVIIGIVVLFLALVFVLLGRRVLKSEDGGVVPQAKLTFWSFFEVLVDAVMALMVPIMGEEKARRFLPLVGSLAIFILFSNLIGMIPGLLPATDNLNTTLALGTVVFFVTHIAGVKEHGLSYFKHFAGPIWWLAPLMIPIELISHVVRPVSLGIRLMGNMFGDHKVLGIFLGFGVLFLPLPIQVMGLLVAVVQTLVFCLLSVIYIGMAVADDH